MNRRDIFKMLAVAPAAVLPLPKEEPKREAMTIVLPPAAPAGTHVEVISMGDKWVVLR